MIEDRLITLLFWLLFFCSVSTSSVHGARQTNEGGQLSVPPPSDGLTLSDQARRQLKDKLDSTVPTSLQVVNVDGAPLEINAARVSSVKIEGNYDATGSPVHMINDYAVKLTLRLSNPSGRPVTGLGFEFKDLQENNGFFVYRTRVGISQEKSFTIGIAFMVLTGDPAHLSVELYGVGYADATTWGAFPFPKPRAPSAHAQTTTTKPPAAIPSPPAPAGQVDVKPRLLNSPRPRYTEEARKNGVFGTVLLRVLIRAEGNVIRVNARSTLPDWLTEEAIRAAYELKFEPARKDGKPVAYWMPVLVEFNLK